MVLPQDKDDNLQSILPTVSTGLTQLTTQLQVGFSKRRDHQSTTDTSQPQVTTSPISIMDRYYRTQHAFTIKTNRSVRLNRPSHNSDTTLTL